MCTIHETISYKNISLFVYIQLKYEPLHKKTTIHISKSKDADQLRSNCEADRHLSFRDMDSRNPVLLKFKILSFKLFSETVQAGLCWTWSKTQNVGGSCHETMLVMLQKRYMYIIQLSKAV